MKTIFITMIVLACFLTGCGPSHPSDKILLANFQRNEADFEKLLIMIRADRKLFRVDDNWTDPADPNTVGVTPERIRTYRELFGQLCIPRGFHAFHDPERFTFIASTFGLGVSGSSKGYAYMAEKPDLVVDDLDEYWSTAGKPFIAYRLVKGNWYLYYDCSD